MSTILKFCFTGFNSTLRQGNITHHEYIQVLVHGKPCYCICCKLNVELFCLQNWFMQCECVVLYNGTRLVSKYWGSFAGWKRTRCGVESNCCIWSQSGLRQWRANSESWCLPIGPTLWPFPDAVLLLYFCGFLCDNNGRCQCDSFQSQLVWCWCHMWNFQIAFVFLDIVLQSLRAEQ